MQFRKISESMTDHEAEALLHILLPGSNFRKESGYLHFARMKSIIFQKN